MVEKGRRKGKKRVGRKVKGERVKGGRRKGGNALKLPFAFKTSRIRPCVLDLAY